MDPLLSGSYVQYGIGPSSASLPSVFENGYSNSPSSHSSINQLHYSNPHNHQNDHVADPSSSSSPRNSPNINLILTIRLLMQGKVGWWNDRVIWKKKHIHTRHTNMMIVKWSKKWLWLEYFTYTNICLCVIYFPNHPSLAMKKTNDGLIIGSGQYNREARRANQEDPRGVGSQNQHFGRLVSRADRHNHGHSQCHQQSLRYGVQQIWRGLLLSVLAPFMFQSSI